MTFVFILLKSGQIMMRYGRMDRIARSCFIPRDMPLQAIDCTYNSSTFTLFKISLYNY